MGLFGNLFGSSDSTNDNSTTTNQTDTSANAGTDSIAQTGSNFIGSGALASGGGAITITNSDPDVALGAVRANSDLAAKLTTSALDGIQTVVGQVYKDQENARDAAAANIQTNVDLAKMLSAQVADSKKDPNNLTLETGIKYVFYAVAAIAAAWAFSLLFRGGSSKQSKKK